MSTTKGSATDNPFPYSDHEALSAELRLKTHSPAETESDGKSKNQESAAGRFTSRHQQAVSNNSNVSWSVSDIRDLQMMNLADFAVAWLFI